MSRKMAQLAAVFAVVVALFLSLLPVAADEGAAPPLAEPTPTPAPLQDLQELQPDSPPADALVLPAGQTDDLPEVVELRTANSKHYQLGPNLYRAQISAGPIHFRDAEGNWQDIDLTPVAQPQGGFQIEAGPLQLAFPETLAQAGLEMRATIQPAPPADTQPRFPPREKPDPASLVSPASAGTSSPAAVQLSLQWQPQYLAYANDAGVVASLPAAAVGARATDQGVEYGQVFAGMDLSYRVSAVGLLQRLRFSGPPAAEGTGAATRLEYGVRVALPAIVELYAHGARQAGGFTTEQVELRDQDGNLLALLPAPQLFDQTASRNSPRARYRVEPVPGGMMLVAELPLAWLADPARQYPVTADAGAVFPLGQTADSFTAIKDTWIWQCSPVSTFWDWSTMWVGTFGCNGAGAERSLAQWTISSLPQDAMIVGPTDSRLWRLPGSDTGTALQNIGTYRLVAPWLFEYATWVSRTNTSQWSQPGAEDDYLVAAEDSVNVPAGGAPGYISMGGVESLVGAWHTDQYFDPWGDPNYGVLYRDTTEAPVNLDRAFAQLGASGVVSAPLLAVTYYTNSFFTLPADGNYFLSRAPSPDYFRIDGMSKWRAVGIRPLDGRSDYDLFLSTSTNFTFSAIVSYSVASGNATDFIVISPNVTDPLYPWTIQWAGTGLYYIRYPTQQQDLTLGGTALINGTAHTYTVLSIYRTNLTAGQDYRLTLDVTSGNADLGLALFPPAAGGGKDFMDKDDAFVRSDAPVFGGDEELVFSPPASGWYGLVVWNNGGTQPSNYQVKLEDRGFDLYLPVVLKNYVAPLPDFANGSFETGAFPPWNHSGPGGPMVASVVANPAAGCFPGSYTARLGTPGQVEDNTIPEGEVRVEQQFNVPGGATQLIVKYQIFSYDIIYGPSQNRNYDWFNVTLNGTPVFTGGNPATSSNGNTLWQSGCQSKTFNISAYAGKNMSLGFSLFNTNGKVFNTWAYVDSVQIK